MIVVVDLDGTLANVDHRTNLVRRAKPKFDNFFKLAYKDKINLWCKQMILSLVKNGIGVRIVSARPLASEEMTRRWLENCLHPEWYDLDITLNLLRGERDFTPDVDLKKKWLEEGLAAEGLEKSDILFVVDDRKRVVDMWRAAGLVCLHCYEWEEFDKKALK